MHWATAHEVGGSARRLGSLNHPFNYHKTSSTTVSFFHPKDAMRAAEIDKKGAVAEITLKEYLDSLTEVSPRDLREEKGLR